MTNRNLFLAALACLLVAAASLQIAAEPVYDAWAWLVWGRELAALDLDTSSGPSFKPLPVAVTAVLSVAGDAAPDIWLALVRASWLLALILAGAVAHALSAGLGRRPQALAAAFAVLSLALLRDDITMWARQGAAGMSEPVLVALVLGAVVAGLRERWRTALVLGALAALVRPEVWPLLGAYGLWRWREQPALRPWLVAVAVAAPALWIVPEMLAGGDGASAGERARRGDEGPAVEMVEALWRAVQMPLLVAWPLALHAIAGRRRWRGAGLRLRAEGAGPRGDGAGLRGDGAGLPADGLGGASRAMLVLGAGALALIAIVVAMAAIGFPGLPRFTAPAAAVVGVLGGVGLARWLATQRPARPRAMLVPLLALVLVVVQAGYRIGELPHAISTTARIAGWHDDLRTLAGEVGRERLLRCGRLATSDVLVRTALAWELRVPLGDVVTFGEPPTNSGAFVVGPQASPLLRAYMRGHTDLVAARGKWRVYSLGCPPAGAADSSSSASDSVSGVSGALL